MRRQIPAPLSSPALCSWLRKLRIHMEVLLLGVVCVAWMSLVTPSDGIDAMTDEVRVFPHFSVI